MTATTVAIMGIALAAPLLLSGCYYVPPPAFSYYPCVPAATPAPASTSTVTPAPTAAATSGCASPTSAAQAYPAYPYPYPYYYPAYPYYYPPVALGFVGFRGRFR